MTLQKPFWYDFDISWRQLYWIEMFLSAKVYYKEGHELVINEGKLIFYKDGTVRLIKSCQGDT